LDLKDHKALDLTSRQIAQYSFYRQVPIIVTILQEGATPSKLTLPYLKLIKDGLDYNLELKANRSLKDFILLNHQKPHLLKKQSTALMCRFLELNHRRPLTTEHPTTNQPTKFAEHISQKEIFELPYKNLFPPKDLAELTVIENWPQIIRNKTCLSSEQIVSFLDISESSHYIRLYNSEDQMVWIPLFTYLMTQPVLLQVRSLVLNFLRVFDKILLRNYSPEAMGNIFDRLQREYLEQFLLSAINTFEGDQIVQSAIDNVVKHFDFLTNHPPFSDRPCSLRTGLNTVLAAVQLNGQALEYTNNNLNNSREVVLAAVKAYGKA
jgi:hypothetical protein